MLGHSGFLQNTLCWGALKRSWHGYKQ